jgi:hypothetical protein
MSRRSSLFAASHQGAKRSVLFYSLAYSCKLHNINTFEYFKDILDRLAKLPDPEMHPENTQRIATGQMVQERTITSNC